MAWEPARVTHIPYQPEAGKPTEIRVVIAEYDELGNCVGSFNASSKKKAINYLRRSY